MGSTGGKACSAGGVAVALGPRAKVRSPAGDARAAPGVGEELPRDQTSHALVSGSSFARCTSSRASAPSVSRRSTSSREPSAPSRITSSRNPSSARYRSQAIVVIALPSPQIHSISSCCLDRRGRREGTRRLRRVFARSQRRDEAMHARHLRSDGAGDGIQGRRRARGRAGEAREGERSWREWKRPTTLGVAASEPRPCTGRLQSAPGRLRGDPRGHSGQLRERHGHRARPLSCRAGPAVTRHRPRCQLAAMQIPFGHEVNAAPARALPMLGRHADLLGGRRARPAPRRLYAARASFLPRMPASLQSIDIDRRRGAGSAVALNRTPPAAQLGGRRLRAPAAARRGAPRRQSAKIAEWAGPIAGRPQGDGRGRSHGGEPLDRCP